MHPLYVALWQCAAHARFSPREEVVALFLDQYLCPFRYLWITSGVVDHCYLHPREVFLPALECDATSIVLAHTHPSGTLHPSQEDRQTTQLLNVAANALRIPFLAHLILTRDTWAVIG